MNPKYLIIFALGITVGALFKWLIVFAGILFIVGSIGIYKLKKVDKRRKKAV